MEGLLGHTQEAERIRSRLLYLAWRRYRIAPGVAEDIVQSAIATFLEVRERYPDPSEHPAILTGIFRNKCREHIDESVRERRRFQAFCLAALTSRERRELDAAASQADTPVLEDLIRREDADRILLALSELRPEAREMFRLIIEENASRAELIDRYGVNKNTLDSRLRTYRQELRKLLARRGVRI